eukprot:TRINITY_DN16396_c0_g2_i2.p1 TRINITY_DN16396_c0_g2~~TRINITY_DN16396_c0_g2_i2.p1  ORF type:complete len:385 (+),score=30.07 TRINITY_DN16396_c0_g2_i2:115-1155(+)
MLYIFFCIFSYYVLGQQQMDNEFVSNDMGAASIEEAWIQPETDYLNITQLQMSCIPQPELPLKIAEVSSCVIGSKLITMGDGNFQSRLKTLIYDGDTQTWSLGADRLYEGDHMGAVSHGDSCYILGGQREAQGHLQIYNLTSDTWSEGPPIPVTTASATAVKIDNYIYYCSGIINNEYTVDACVKLNLDTFEWEDMEPIPEGVNHAASCTDGRSLFVFGGRKGRNRPGPGYDFVQEFDPVTGTWTLHDERLPEARGGMGNCVCMDGYCHIFGGETKEQNRPYLTKKQVYTVIDRYNIQTGEFDVAGEMYIGMHGIYPIWFQDKIHIAGGGTQIGVSRTQTHMACSY